MSERPLSERVFEELMASDCWCEKCKAHAEEVRDEIAALEEGATMSDVHGSRTVNDRPLSEGVRERGARWGVEYGIFLVDATVERDWQADVAGEIAALEAKAALADELVADVNRLNRMVDDLGAEVENWRTVFAGDKEVGKKMWEAYHTAAAIEPIVAERDRLRAALDERCVCEEGYRCDFCAVLEEGGGERELSKRVQNRIPDTRGRR